LTRSSLLLHWNSSPPLVTLTLPRSSIGSSTNVLVSGSKSSTGTCRTEIRPSPCWPRRGNSTEPQPPPSRNEKHSD
jgi:hypothetical protein